MPSWLQRDSLCKQADFSIGKRLPLTGSRRRLLIPFFLCNTRRANVKIAKSAEITVLQCPLRSAAYGWPMYPLAAKLAQCRLSIRTASEPVVYTNRPHVRCACLITGIRCARFLRRASGAAPTLCPRPWAGFMGSSSGVGRCVGIILHAADCGV